MFLWIWNIRNLGTPQEVVDRVKSLDIKDVCLKYHEGSSPMNFKGDFLHYAPVLRANGIKVGAWGYNYFNYPETEANMIIDALNNADYYIFDSEAEIEGKRKQATYVLSKVRQAKPLAKIGYAPFPYVSFHSSFPYSVFNEYCDFASPQCYAAEIGTKLSICINRTIQEFANAGLNKPLYPSVEGYKIADYSPLDGKFPSVGIWDLDEIQQPCINWLRSNPSSGGDGGTTPAEDDAVKQLQHKLNILLQAGLQEDGIMGSKTKAAIIKFQNVAGINADGIAGNVTYNAMQQIFNKPLCKRGSKGIAVRYIQYRTGAAIDGIFGWNTLTCVQHFQVTRKLVADGIVGPLTWNKLIG